MLVLLIVYEVKVSKTGAQHNGKSWAWNESKAAWSKKIKNHETIITSPIARAFTIPTAITKKTIIIETRPGRYLVNEKQNQFVEDPVAKRAVIN